MKTLAMFALAASVTGALLSGAAAQGVPQTVGIAKVDVGSLATGFRASKVVGSSVYNGAGDTIGKIDDVIISGDGKVPYAVISVGGFLGMGSRLALVRYDDLRVANSKITLPGGTKEQLTALPEFKYQG